MEMNDFPCWLRLPSVRLWAREHQISRGLVDLLSPLKPPIVAARLITMISLQLPLVLV